MLRKGMFLADRYEIIDQIGTGGMSDVYKAKCHKLNRYVAIKVMKEEFSQDKNFVSKFIIEAQSAAGLTHPNIVSVYDVGDENGIYYIVMELVEGITLKKYIEKKGKLGSREAVSIAIQVAQGIEAAHSHHIIHRDIKPQNIIISKEGKVKVTDFGIARAASSNTISSTAMGSVHYISPEQARGGYSDEKGDIYSFGITLYEMLTGTVPFDGDSTVSVAVQHIQDEIQPPSRLVDDIPVSVDRIVMKCTQKKTDRRYQNATDLIADLKKSLVMPDVDFVQIPYDYGYAADVQEERQGSSAVKAADAGAGRRMAEAYGQDDGIELDDELDAELEAELKMKEKYGNREEDEDDEDEYDDYDEGERVAGTRMDQIIKWMGIVIAVIIVVITVFVVVRLAGVMNDASQQQSEQQATQDTVEMSSVDPSTMVKVPSVQGMTEEEAKKALNDAGLGVKVSRQPSETVAEGYVISQSQKADTRIAKNSTITLSVSSGSGTVKVVNVVGKTEEEAVSAIVNAGFGSPSVDYDYSDTVEQGYVIRQSPSGNSSAKASDTISIVVSRGKESKLVTVPNVVNMSETQARQTLDALGLKVTLSATQIMSATIPYGYVAGQNYAQGKEVPEGTTIELTMSIGLGTPTVTLPATGDQNQTAAQAETTGQTATAAASGNN